MAFKSSYSPVHRQISVNATGHLLEEDLEDDITTIPNDRDDERNHRSGACTGDVSRKILINILTPPTPMVRTAGGFR